MKTSELKPRNAAESGNDVRVCYSTKQGTLLLGKIEDALESPLVARVRGKVKLLFTSPPFPLVTKKKYGNETGERYLQWLESLAPKLADLLTDDGSLVVEVGNAWEPGSPVMSTLPLESLLAFKRAASLHLCQHLVCYNPARLPTPAEWVTVRRVRLKDAFTNVWWMSRTPNPDASNRRVLVPYGPDMKRLLRRKTYNSGKRPSGHVVSETGFLSNHGGAISPSVIDPEKLPESLLKFSGTGWDQQYRSYCKAQGLIEHPARMQADLAAFMIQMLTSEDDLVFDPFAGSNTTGAIAEGLGRRWVGVEAREEYALGSRGRFEPTSLTD